MHGIRERVERLQSVMVEFQTEIDSLVTHLGYLQQQSEREDSLLADMNSAIGTEESSLSIEVANLVTDCEDTDHMVE